MGILRKGDMKLGFGLDYEQELSKAWDEDLDVNAVFVPQYIAGLTHTSMF